MWKPVVVATAALAIAGSSIVYAQQRSGGPDGYGDGGPRFEHRHRPSAEDMAAFTDARIAALKAGLELTPDQAKNWPAFEQALRDMAQLRAQRKQAREAANQQDQTQTAPFERLAASGRRHGQDERRAQAHRRCRGAAVSNPQRCAEGSFPEARAHSAAASSHARPQRRGPRRPRPARGPGLWTRRRARRSMVGTPWSSLRPERWRSGRPGSPHDRQ